MIFKLSYKDKKLQWKKQERFGYFSPTNFTDAHGFLNFQVFRFSDFQIWAFRLSPSGFPLYLSPLTLQKDAASIPNATGV